MTGGLLQLATVGIEDDILIKDPQLFHFTKQYKRYTNFSQELEPLLFNTNLRELSGFI